MKTFEIFFALISLTVISIALAAPAAVDSAHWTVDDTLTNEWASAWEISPDCRHAVWVKNIPDVAKDQLFAGGNLSAGGNLYLSSLTEQTSEIQLTDGSECRNPRWSPDGKRIAFISSRADAKTGNKANSQVWLIDPSDKEVRQLTEGDQDVWAFEWSDAEHILFLKPDAPAPPAGQAKKKQSDPAWVAEDETKQIPVRLFEIELQSKRVARLTENTDRIGEFWISPDGSHVVTHHIRSLRNAYDRSCRPIIVLTDLKSGERKQIFSDPKFNLNQLRWQRDGQGFYLLSNISTNPKYSYPSVLEVYHYALATGSIEKVNLHWANELSSRIEFSSWKLGFEVTGDGFIALLANGVRPKAARYYYSANAWHREWLTGVHTNLIGFRIGNDDKTLVYEYSDATHPSQWYRAVLNHGAIESSQQLTDFNPWLRDKSFTEMEVVHWKGARRETVEGLLYYPVGYQQGKKYPMVVELHGGPASLFEDRGWTYPLFNNVLLNEQGYFVFRPNYHGSSEYGLAWAESSIGRLDGIEVEDVEKGVDALISRGLVDPEKLGITGWSEGGSLTAAVTTATKRYKAAIVGEGPIDWIDYWGSSEFGGAFCGSYFGATPLEDPARFIRSSPFYRLNQVTTPTLILWGAADRRAPVEQGWKYYRALQQTGKTDVRFVMFPGEGHSPTKISTCRRALQEEIDWFDKYLHKRADN